ncbi:MAG: patatin-like phospholipase family protein [Candidatus Paracaedibacteraceae bacterium]|nr:patatin-like phospholipase family protein [Candidatus Paracaedibacteraceae bacterium]
MYKSIPSAAKAEKKNGKKKVSVALQGGGSHGAFSWGVMDRLLEDGRFEIEGLTGTSAGGMNAVAIAQGLMKGGNQAARDELKAFWQKISDSGKNSPLNHRGPIDKALGKYTMYHSPGFVIFDYLSRMFSPYELNPLQIDPLKDVIASSFDFDALRKFKGVKVYLCATHVQTGKLRIFGLDEMKIEALQATACLPTIHNAVKVDGEYYWDGGFIGNPVFFPLIYDCESPDIILIQLNPTVREKIPTTAREIGDRLNEITNNASVVREMRAISFISDLIDDGKLDPKETKRVFMHLIEDEDTFTDLGWSSKLNTEWDFFMHLFEKGRAAADKWIKENYEHVGKKTTAPLREHFVGEKWRKK